MAERAIFYEEVAKSLRKNKSNHPLPRKIRCPIRGCGASFRSNAAMICHTKYFHGDAYPQNSRKGRQSSSTSEKIKFYCQEEECLKKNEGKGFKNYQCLRQHYMTAHATKVYQCKKCEEEFSVYHKLKEHQMNCSLKLQCSCGVTYYGRRGLLAHIKKTKHSIPESAMKYFVRSGGKNFVPVGGDAVLTSSNKAYKVNVTDVRNQDKRKMPRTNPIPILPKGSRDPQFVYIGNPQPIVIQMKQSNLASKSRPLEPKMQGVKPKTKLRYIIDVIVPENTIPSDIPQPFSSSIPQISTVSNVDSLSQAMLTSGIDSSTVVQPNRVQIDELSKKSQTNRSVEFHHQAQDFSCQTDEFLSWLDSESDKCSSMSVNPTVNICTQTLQTVDLTEVGSSSHSPNCAKEKNVAQNETQTNDDWISALFQEDTPPSNAANQTLSFQHQTGINSVNQSNSTYCNMTSEQSCNIHTQTSLVDTMADVTTQTNYLSACSESTLTDFEDPLLSYFVSDSQTQTDLYCNADSTHAQTACCYDDFVEYLNMQTQTDG